MQSICYVCVRGGVFSPHHWHDREACYAGGPPGLGQMLRGIPRHNLEPPVSDQPPAVGSVLQGTVHTVRHFGLFVAVPGHRRHVLVHSSQVWIPFHNQCIGRSYNLPMFWSSMPPSPRHVLVHSSQVQASRTWREPPPFALDVLVDP